MKLLVNRGTWRKERTKCCGLKWKRLPELDLRCVGSHDPQRGLLQKKTKEEGRGGGEEGGEGGRKRRKKDREEEKRRSREEEKEEEEEWE